VRDQLVAADHDRPILRPHDPLGSGDSEALGGNELEAGEQAPERCPERLSARVFAFSGLAKDLCSDGGQLRQDRALRVDVLDLCEQCVLASAQGGNVGGGCRVLGGQPLAERSVAVGGQVAVTSESLGAPAGSQVLWNELGTPELAITRFCNERTAATSVVLKMAAGSGAEQP
jgi:hypothetical protein